MSGKPVEKIPLEDTDLHGTYDNPPQFQNLRSGCGPRSDDKSPSTTFRSNLNSRIDPYGEVLHIINTIEDGRPFASLLIAGNHERGLLDSGSAVTVIMDNPNLQKLNLEQHPTSLNLKVADGGYLDVLGYMIIPMQFRGKKIEMPTVIVKECVQKLILGFDFWKSAGLHIVDSRGLEVAALTTTTSKIAEVETEIELQSRDKQALSQIVNTFLITTKNF